MINIYTEDSWRWSGELLYNFCLLEVKIFLKLHYTDPTLRHFQTSLAVTYLAHQAKREQITDKLVGKALERCLKHFITMKCALLLLWAWEMFRLTAEGAPAQIAARFMNSLDFRSKSSLWLSQNQKFVACCCNDAFVFQSQKSTAMSCRFPYPS